MFIILANLEKTKGFKFKGSALVLQNKVTKHENYKYKCLICIGILNALIYQKKKEITIQYQ